MSSCFLSTLLDILSPHGTHTIHLQGDTSDGTTLVGLNLETGTEMCRGAIPVREMGFVGFAQSLDFVGFTFCSFVYSVSYNYTNNNCYFDIHKCTNLSFSILFFLFNHPTSSQLLSFFPSNRIPLIKILSSVD